MPVSPVKVKGVMNAIKTRLDLIVGAPDYNTNPTKQIGVPRDPVPEGAGERLYLQHDRTEPLYDEAGPSHAFRATYFIWCVSGDPVNGPNKALDLGADVFKALWGTDGSGHGAIETAGANGGTREGAFVRDVDAESRIGATVYSYAVLADFLVEHGAL